LIAGNVTVAAGEVTDRAIFGGGSLRSVDGPLRLVAGSLGSEYGALNIRCGDLGKR
jgi:hypothetical protein